MQRAWEIRFESKSVRAFGSANDCVIFLLMAGMVYLERMDDLKLLNLMKFKAGTNMWSLNDRLH